jgi:hypothetical protein
MSDNSRSLYELVEGGMYAAALKFLNSCNDEEAERQLTKKVWTPGAYQTRNVLMLAAEEGGAPEELIRAMIKRGPKNYINFEIEYGYAAAKNAARRGNAALLDLLLTLGADSKRCRYFPHASTTSFSPNSVACAAVLYRFEQRTTLACCLRHYDELHASSPLSLHPGIAALSPFAKILHDLHGINGESHDFSRMILSYI